MPRSFAARRAVERRRAKRDNLWPDAATAVFQTASGGWAQMPRTIPMIASLIDVLGKKDNAGRLYLALWAYEYGDGFVEIPDPVQLALEAGYLTQRAERTFRERMLVLQNLSLIRTAPLGLREFGYVLLLDPHRVLAELRSSEPGLIPDRWWTAFSARCAAVGISLVGPAVSSTA